MRSAFGKITTLSPKKLLSVLVFLSLFILATFLIYKYSNQNTREAAIPVKLVEVSISTSTLMLADDFVFRQDDSRWGDETIGDTTDTLSAFGCTIASVAQATSNLTRTEVTPAMLEANLSDANGFTSRGLLIWDKVFEATDGKVKAEYYDYPKHEDIKSCMDAGNYPVIKIKLYGSIIHWVTIVGTTQDDYLIRDPLIGDANDAPLELSERSADIYGVRCITGL